MTRSWEWYQQPAEGTTFPLVWICGLASTTGTGTFSAFPEFDDILENFLFAVPFDQLKTMTVDSILSQGKGVRTLFRHLLAL